LAKQNELEEAKYPTAGSRKRTSKKAQKKSTRAKAKKKGTNQEPVETVHDLTSTENAAEHLGVDSTYYMSPDWGNLDMPAAQFPALVQGPYTLMAPRVLPEEVDRPGIDPVLINLANETLQSQSMNPVATDRDIQKLTQLSFVFPESVPTGGHDQANQFTSMPAPIPEDMATKKRKRTQTADDLAAAEASKYGALAPRRQHIGNRKYARI
jgi:hypothetical protein